jgi:hypothetical protein
MEANEAMKVMARRICSEMATTDVDRTLFLNGEFDRFPEMRSALAAIMETQEACAKLADRRVAKIKSFYADDIGMSDMRVTCEMEAERFATAIRTGEHYALAGEDIGGGRG